VAAVTVSESHLGTDLRLLGDLERQAMGGRGADLRVEDDDPRDLVSVTGHENLAQALLLRFLTPAGELAALGHPDYGSHLFELIGELNNVSNRNIARMYVLQAIEAEPRVADVLSLQVTQGGDRVSVLISMRLRVIDSDVPLNLVFPFSLEGGATP
jgi:phage baseplate assembly protein W